MKLFDLLSGILDKIKKGVPLDKVELTLIKNMLQKEASRSYLFARAFLEHYSKLPEKDKRKARESRLRLELITTNAINRLLRGERPFNEDERRMLEDIFEDFGLDGRAVAKAYIANFTIVFGMGLKESLQEIARKEAEQEKLGVGKRIEEEKGKLKV